MDHSSTPLITPQSRTIDPQTKTVRERSRRREEALRQAREGSEGRREDLEADTDEDTQPSYGDTGSQPEDDDESMAEDRGLWGTNDPSDIEIFQEAGVTLLLTEPEYYHHGTDKDEEGNIMAGEWVPYGLDVDSDFGYEMDRESDWQLYPVRGGLERAEREYHDKLLLFPQYLFTEGA
jgi:hypothetical protein